MPVGVTRASLASRGRVDHREKVDHLKRRARGYSLLPLQAAGGATGLARFARSVCVLTLAALSPALAQDEPARTTRDGVYTAEQAERGQETYKQACAACHPLDWYKTGVMKSWEGGTLLALYDSIATPMPPDNPGSLKRREYVDPVAYILSLNEHARGRRRAVRSARRAQEDPHQVEEQAMTQAHAPPARAPRGGPRRRAGFEAAPASAQRKGTEKGEWRYWGADEGSSRYSPLDQINAENVAKLEVAWRWYAAQLWPRARLHLPRHAHQGRQPALRGGRATPRRRCPSTRPRARPSGCGG